MFVKSWSYTLNFQRSVGNVWDRKWCEGKSLLRRKAGEKKRRKKQVENKCRWRENKYQKSGSFVQKPRNFTLECGSNCRERRAGVGKKWSMRIGRLFIVPVYWLFVPHDEWHRLFGLDVPTGCTSWLLQRSLHSHLSQIRSCVSYFMRPLAAEFVRGWLAVSSISPRLHCVADADEKVLCERVSACSRHSRHLSTDRSNPRNSIDRIQGIRYWFTAFGTAREVRKQRVCSFVWV